MPPFNYFLIGDAAPTAGRYYQVDTKEYKTLRKNEGGAYWNFERVTFVLSLVVQLGVLIFSVATLFAGDPPPLLELILYLETVVQLVEFVWYVALGVRWFLFKKEIKVVYRYIDWAVTTPIMLCTLYFLTLYFNDMAQRVKHPDMPCMSVAELRAHDKFALTIAGIVGADLAMLFFGAMVEGNLCGAVFRTVPTDTTETETPKVVPGWLKYPRIFLSLGFLPLVLAFLPHVVTASTNPSDEAGPMILVTFVLWALYGVVAVAAYGEQYAPWRNAFYNILDLLSKNLAGVVVSVVALGATCPAAL